MTNTRIMACLTLCALLAACSREAPEQAASRPNFVESYNAQQSAAKARESQQSQDTEVEQSSGQWWDALPRPEWAQYTVISTYHPWFEVYEIRRGIYAIYEPGQFEEVISYLIVGRKRALLFDTGLGMGDIRGVAKEITKKQIVVLNSHSHYDHVGGNRQFDIILGRDLPYTLKNSRGKPHAEVAEFASKDWIWKPTPPNFDARTYAIKPWEFSRWVDQGEIIDLGDVSLEVIYAPGHAPDSIVLVDRNRRLMFTGDVFYPAPLYAHLEGSDFDTYAATAEKLAGMAADVDTLLTSHNLPEAPSSNLLKLDNAFKSIKANTAAWKPVETGREYTFEGFSILTLDPPQGAAAPTASP